VAPAHGISAANIAIGVELDSVKRRAAETTGAINRIGVGDGAWDGISRLARAGPDF